MGSDSGAQCAAPPSQEVGVGPGWLDLFDAANRKRNYHQFQFRHGALATNSGLRVESLCPAGVACAVMEDFQLAQAKASTATVSVLIAAYRSEGTIQRAISSALQLPSAEVVIAPDDGSGSYDALKRIDAARVKVLTPCVRTGPGRSRNRAFYASAGQFVTMLDADDYFGPGVLEEALDLAQNWSKEMAFLRTAYVHATSGRVCRELPRSTCLDFQAFTDFNGSIHALYPRQFWRPYSSHPIAQDVLFDANLLLACGGVAPLTHAPHVKTIHPQSTTCSVDQTAINQEYAEIANQTEDLCIRRLFLEKLRVGTRYADAQSAGFAGSFHEFVALAILR